MSYSIGPGGRGVVGQQQAAAHHAAQRAHQQSAFTAQQNLLRHQMMNRQLLLQVVQEVAEAAPTQEDAQNLAEIVREAEQQRLEPEQVESRLREATPFAWLLPLLPQNRSERIAYLQMLVEVIFAAIALVVGLRPSTPEPQPPPAITPEQVQEIVDQLERVVDEMEEQPQPAPTPPPASPTPEPPPPLAE